MPESPFLTQLLFTQVSHIHTHCQCVSHFDTRLEHNTVAGAWDYSQEEHYAQPHFMVAIQ